MIRRRATAPAIDDLDAACPLHPDMLPPGQGKIHGFGTGMPGLEPELADALRRGERLVDALAAMRRLPRVSRDTLELVIARRDHPDARVRQQALQVLGEFDDDAAARARPLLRDPAPGPRRAALDGVRQNAARMLGEVGDARVRGGLAGLALLGFLRSPPDPRRKAIIWSFPSGR